MFMKPIPTVSQTSTLSCSSNRTHGSSGLQLSGFSVEPAPVQVQEADALSTFTVRLDLNILISSLKPCSIPTAIGQGCWGNSHDAMSSSSPCLYLSPWLQSCSHQHSTTITIAIISIIDYCLYYLLLLLQITQQRALWPWLNIPAYSWSCSVSRPSPPAFCSPPHHSPQPTRLRHSPTLTLVMFTVVRSAARETC